MLDVGDTFTDDLQWWLEILRHLLELRPTARRGAYRNRRRLGSDERYSTSPLRHARLAGAGLGASPLSLGGNDAIWIGPEPNKAQVSLEEAMEYLQAMRRIAS